MKTLFCKSKRKKPRFTLISWCLGLLTLAGLIATCISWHFLQRFHSTADKIIFHSQLQFQAVAVPFKLENNLISCYADFAGRREDCIVDTGSSAILWPRNANLPGKKSFSWGFAKDGAGNQVNLTEYVLTTIQIGSYELQGVPTLAISGNSNAAHSYPDLRRVCDLGNTAFSQAVMTIDYKKRLLSSGAEISWDSAFGVKSVHEVRFCSFARTTSVPGTRSSARFCPSAAAAGAGGSSVCKRVHTRTTRCYVRSPS